MVCPGNAMNIYPSVWTEQRLSDEHVPLLFYAPYLLAPQRRTEVVSQIDVLPTIAGMVQQPYVNTTLGRDLLHHDKQNNYAFIIYHDEGRIGVVTDTYYFTKNLNFSEEHLYPVAGEILPYSLAQQDSIKKKMTDVTNAIYETGRWMLMNNKE
jgi:phosphoglycerol transferase MdoB-like AlkP superfamily enzyme